MGTKAKAEEGMGPMRPMISSTSFCASLKGVLSCTLHSMGHKHNYIRQTGRDQIVYLHPHINSFSSLPILILSHYPTKRLLKWFLPLLSFFSKMAVARRLVVENTTALSAVLLLSVALQVSVISSHSLNYLVGSNMPLTLITSLNPPHLGCIFLPNIPDLALTTEKIGSL